MSNARPNSNKRIILKIGTVPRRSLDSRWGLSLFFIRKLTAIITVISFITTSIPYDLALLRPSGFEGQAWAAENPSKLSGVSSDGNGGLGIILPAHLGQITDSYKGSSDKVVLHIQDAHCNYACQHKIAQIIEYFNSEYGADTINLEGGAKDYDLSIFTRIQDNSVREKTADYFVKEGLVNGAEYFAVNNPGKVALWGIEDTKLYINNLNAYRDSLKYKDEIEKDLKALNHILSNLKLKIYSPELLELDSKHNQYKTGSLDFKAYISYLISKNTYHLRGVTGLSNHSPEVNNLHLINQTLEEQDKIDFKKTNIERDILIDKLRKKLSKRSMEEFVLKIVEFKEERMSEKDFYSYLINKADLVGIDLKDYPELQRHIASLSVFGSVDKTKIMEEIEVLEHSIKEAVIARSEAARQSQCRQLDKLSTNLAIMKNIFNISLTKNEYKYFMANKDSFSAANYTSFINKTAPLYKITATLDDNITDLDRHLDNMLKFYEYSFKRDETFLKNLSMTKTDHLRGVTGLSNHSPEVGHGSSKPTILITGGFHTENLTTLLKKQNISYISIMPMPDFRDCESYERPYYRLLAGNISPIGKMLHTAIASSTLAIAALNNALGQEVWGQRNVDTYKAWVALRTILEEDITRITGITRKDKDNLEIAFDDGRTRLITINELFHETGEVIDRQMAEGKFFQISAQDPDRVKALELARRLGKEVEEGINNLANGIEREGHKLQIQEATNLPEGQNEHAGGWGISIRLGLQGDRRTEAILHGIIAGFVENHNNVDSITEALTRNDIKEAERLFKGAGKHQVDGRITALWDMSSTQREERAATRDFAKTRDLSKTRSEQESWKVVVPDGVISQEGPYITESPIRTSPVMKDKILGYEELSTKAKEFVYKNHGREKDIASMWELLKTTGRYVTDEEYEENVRKYIEQQTDRPGSGKAPAFVFRRQGDRNDRPIVMFKLCAGFDKYATANELEKEGERLRLQAGLDYVTDDQGRRLIVDLSTVESGNRMAYMPIEATRVMLPDGTIKVYWGYLGIEEIQEKIKGKIDLTLTRENFDDFVKYGSAWEFKGLGTYNYSSHLVTKSYMTKVNTNFLETLRGRVNNRENLMAYAWTKEERELIERLNEYACKLETKQLSKNVKYEDTPLVKIVNNILQQFDAQKYYIEEIHRPRAILPSLPGQKEGPTITRVTKYIGRRTIQLFIWSERAVIKDLIGRPVYAHGACYQAISNEDLGGCLQRDEERAKDNQKILLAHGARLGSVIDDIIPTGITADDRSDGSQYAIIERLRTSGKNRMMPVDTYRIAMERLIDLKVELMDAKKQLQGDRKNTKLKQHIKKLEEDKDSLIQILTVCQWKIELLKMELGENFGMFFENMGVNTKAFISSEIMFNDELMAEGKDPTDWGDLNDPGEFWNFKNEAPQEIKKFSIIHIRKWLRLQSVFYEAVLAINSRKQPVWITDDDAIPDSFFSDNENLKIFLQGMFKGRLDQKDINGLKHYFAEDFKNDLKARMERMAPDRRTPSYRLIECYQLAAEVIYKYWAYGQQREKPATPESAKPAQLDKPRPGEGGTGFQDNIFEAIKTRLQRGGSTTLTVSEREVLLFGLEGPRYNEVAEVVRQLPEREKIALKADAANFVQPKGADPMSKTLDRALTDVERKIRQSATVEASLTAPEPAMKTAVVTSAAVEKGATPTTASSAGAIAVTRPTVKVIRSLRPAQDIEDYIKTVRGARDRFKSLESFEREIQYMLKEDTDFTGEAGGFMGQEHVIAADLEKLIDEKIAAGDKSFSVCGVGLGETAREIRAFLDILNAALRKKQQTGWTITVYGMDGTERVVNNTAIHIFEAEEIDKWRSTMNIVSAQLVHINILDGESIDKVFYHMPRPDYIFFRNVFYFTSLCEQLYAQERMLVDEEISGRVLRMYITCKNLFRLAEPGKTRLVVEPRRIRLRDTMTVEEAKEIEGLKGTFVPPGSKDLTSGLLLIENVSEMSETTLSGFNDAMRKNAQPAAVETPTTAAKAMADAAVEKGGVVDEPAAQRDFATQEKPFTEVPIIQTPRFEIIVIDGDNDNKQKIAGGIAETLNRILMVSDLPKNKQIILQAGASPMLSITGLSDNKILILLESMRLRRYRGEEFKSKSKDEYEKYLKDFGNGLYDADFHEGRLAYTLGHEIAHHALRNKLKFKILYFMYFFNPIKRFIELSADRIAVEYLLKLGFKSNEIPEIIRSSLPKDQSNNIKTKGLPLFLPELVYHLPRFACNFIAWLILTHPGVEDRIAVLKKYASSIGPKVKSMYENQEFSQLAAIWASEMQLQIAAPEPAANAMTISGEKGAPATPAQIAAAEPSATPVPSAASVSTADNTSITRRGFIKKAAVAAGAATVAGGGVALLIKGKNQPQEAEKITKTSDNELILPSDENTIKGIGKFLRTRFRNPGDIVGTITNWQVKESIELSNSRYKGLVKEIYDLLIAKGLWDKGKNRYPVLFLKGGMNGPAVGGIALIEHGIILINMEEPENALKVQLAELIAHEGQHLINHYEKQGISHLEDEYLAFWATWRATSILKREDKKAVEAASLVYRAFKVLVDNKDRVCRLMDVKPEDFKALQYSGYFIDESKDSKEKFIGINLYNSKTLEREPHTIFIDVGNRKIIEGGKPKSIDELSPEEHKKMEELIKKLNNLHATAYPVPSNFATDIITAGAMPATVPFAAKTTEHEVISTESRFSQKVVDKAVAAAMPAQIAAAAAGVAKIAVDKREALKSKLRPIGTIRSELIQERYSGLLAEIFDILPASVIEVINENFEEIDCNNDAISVGDGQYYEEGKTVKVGPCFDPLYFLKTALHEIAHSFEGQLQSYLKERGLWSTDSIDSVIIHEFTDALSMYILYPEEFRRFTVEGNAAKRWAAVYNFYKELFGGKEYMPQEISIIRDHINRLRELDSKDMMRYETIGLIKILVSNQRTAGETLPTVLLKNIEALLFPENEASSGIAATVVEKGAAAKPEQIAAPEPAAKAAAAVRKGDKRAQRFMRDYSWIFDRSGKFKYKDDEDIERLAKALSDFVKEQLPGAEFYNDTLPYRDAFKFIKDNFKDKRSARKAMQRLCEIYDKYSKLIAEVNRRYQKTFGIEGMGFGKIVFRCFRDDDPISVDAPSQNIDGLKNMKIQLDLASLLDKSNDFFGVGTIAHESGHLLKHFVASGFNAPRDLRAAFKRDLADEELLASWVAARICSNKELEGIVKDSARVWENIVKKDMGVSLASQLTVFAKICGASETGFGPTDANLLKTYKDYYGSLTLKGLAVPAGAMAPSAESRAYATEQTTEDRKDAMVKAFPDSRDNEVTVIMILPEGMSKNDIQPVQSAINGGLVKNRIGRMEDNRQVIIVTDGNIDKVKEQIRQIKDDRERRGAKGRFVIYAHKNESGSINVARSLQEYSQKESNVTVISDAYADFNPGENAYPDIMVRVVLGRDIAFYLDLKELNKDTSKVEVTINNLLENVAGGITLNDLLNMLKSLVLKRVNYSRDIGMWRKSQLEAATAI